MQRLAAGRQTYLNVCAGCHGRDGEGKPHVAVAMLGNSTLRLADPRNLVVSVLDGLPAQEFPGLERMQDMPGFAGTLSDAEIAELATICVPDSVGRAPTCKPRSSRICDTNSEAPFDIRQKRHVCYRSRISGQRRWLLVGRSSSPRG